MFDLNASEFQGTSIFNGGNAGLVKNVEITVEKKQDTSNSPDYKLIAKDSSGTINVGFYYPTSNPQKTEEDNNKYAKLQLSRVVHLARAVMGKDYPFPEVNSVKEGFDVLFKLVMANSKDKKFNIYTTYGTNDRPSKYLGFRYFNFIEPATDNTTLLPNNRDMLERLVEDDNNESLGNTNDITSDALSSFKL